MYLFESSSYTHIHYAASVLLIYYYIVYTLSIVKVPFIVFKVSPGGLDVIANQPDAFSLGDNVTFTCSSLGGPDNMFQWQKEGEDLPSESLSILTLTDVNATDGGLYTCVVTNAAGNDSSDITLNISPYFILQPNDTLTNNGDSLTLSCGAEGFPDPVYQWFRNDNEMIRSNLTGVNSNMLLFEPVLFGDEGGYYCTATSNGIAVNSTTAIITGEGFICLTINCCINCTCMLAYIELFAHCMHAMNEYT